MIGSRIHQARLIAGWSMDQLVSELSAVGFSITKAAISKYETGKSTPNAKTIFKLAQVLKVRADYFLTESTLSVEWLAFRRSSKLTITSQERVKLYAAQTAERYIELESLLYPDEKPEFPSPRPVTTFEQAEAAAEDLRQAWQLDDHPIDNLFQTVEDHGGIVVEWHGDIGQFDGLSGWGNGVTPIAVINMQVKEDRRRFNLAHELGHLLMDTDQARKDEEKLAHRFAAALLVPAHVAIRELGQHRQHLDWREIGLLKEKYGMSMAAWAYRAKDLNIISANYHAELWRELSAQGWRKNEPFDYVGKEEPSRLKQMVLRAVAERIISANHGRTICPDYFESLPAAPQKSYQSARDLLKLPAEQRNQLAREALERSQTEDAERFEAFGEADFDDEYSEVANPMSQDYEG